MKDNGEIRTLSELAMRMPEKELLELEYFRNRGSNFLKRALIPDERGRWERAFSNAIKQNHEKNNMSSILGESDEQLTAGFSCFQWLATNCGMAVLGDALEECGLKIERIDDSSI
jgi:hypothetical protein